jgi:hypothetical protein
MSGRGHKGGAQKRCPDPDVGPALQYWRHSNPPDGLRGIRPARAPYRLANAAFNGFVEGARH